MELANRTQQNYKCVLCPVEHTEHVLVEQPKRTHHKKKMSEKDREWERLQVQQARKALELYRNKQEDLHRPLSPREPLKRTADNNWVHVTCAVFTPEVKFGNAKTMEPSEGIPSIARAKYDEVCGVCNKTDGACMGCVACRAPCKSNEAIFVELNELLALTIYTKIMWSVLGNMVISSALRWSPSRALVVIKSTL